MKKFNLGLSIGLLIGFLVFSIPALADGIIKVNLLVNGQKHNAEVIMVNNKTYVPLRQFSELIGYKVDWNQKTSTVSLSNDGSENGNVDSESVNSNNETSKDYTITRDSGYTIVMFNDGFTLSINGSNTNNNSLNKYFHVTLVNFSSQNIYTDYNCFKYVSSVGTIVEAEPCILNNSYLNNIELYPKTNSSGMLLFKEIIDIDYLIYNDGIHYAEIHDITTSDLTNGIKLFLLNS